MLKLGVVVIHIPNNINVAQQVLVGDSKYLGNFSLPVWDASRIEFLAGLSRLLLKSKNARQFPDVITFAYWLRKSNLHTLKNSSPYVNKTQMGLGLTFHICPANVAVNFAYSMAFGLLAGNTCVLRLPSTNTPTTQVIVDAIKDLLQTSQYAYMQESLLLLRYQHNDDVNAFWLGKADGRIIWGGDNTVKHMRSFQVPARSKEIAFSDRYSFCILKASSIIELKEDEDEYHHVVESLYNDIFLMDQAACSSPQLVVWVGNKNKVNVAQKKLWSALSSFAEKKYTMSEIQVMNKYVDLCEAVITNTNIDKVNQYNKCLTTIELSTLDKNQESIRGYSGTIYESKLEDISELSGIINERYQTLSYLGFEPEDLVTFIEENRLRGIDRIVPIGQAIDMNTLWDGYDIITSISRIIAIN